jgi:proteic killer suppression protein
MDFRFATDRLHQLYTSKRGARRYPSGIVDAFLRRVRHIEAAVDERDLRAPPGVQFERLRQGYQGKCSLRLNEQWRLIIEIREEKGRKIVLIHEISKHYER